MHLCVGINLVTHLKICVQLFKLENYTANRSRSVVKINVCTLTSVANVLILDERRPTREKCKGDEIRCIEDTGNKYELCFTIDFNKSFRVREIAYGFGGPSEKNVSPH
jgi:hypothetical protein